MTNLNSLRVSVLGYGAIGSRVAAALASDKIARASLVGVVARSERSRDAAHAAGLTTLDLEGAIAESDLIVECTGGPGAREHGPRVIAAGCNLLLVSMGVLADEELRRTLLEDGPGTCFLTSGGIGGLDILRAAAIDQGLDAAMLTSTKKAAALVQPWMDEVSAEALRSATSPQVIFEGDIQEAIRLFPASLNVGVALAAATGLWQGTRVRLIGDPAAELTTHEIEASGSAGKYSFQITNYPLPANPTSSAIVSAALLRGVASLAQPAGSFI